MQLMGEQSIPADQESVWRGMNDPELLKRCIAVCESFERQSETLFRAVLAIKVGPFPRARFTIMVGIENAHPPYAYRLVAEGKGGIVGWAHATADVRLQAHAAETRLYYDATANINGALGRLAETCLVRSHRPLHGGVLSSVRRTGGLIERKLI